jgi:ATP-dependent Clp protease, protease subunit
MPASNERPLHESEIARAYAEAAKANAEAEAAIMVAKAEAAKGRSETRKFDAEATAVELGLVKAKNDAEREKEKRNEELAANKHHHVYVFDKEVGVATVKECIGQFATWERTAGTPVTIELELNSPGGSVVDGFALFDFITGMQNRGHTVNTTAYGMAASMAGVLLQAGNVRAMGSNAVLLIHEASFAAVGSYGEVQDRVKLVDIFHERILKLLVDRSKVTKQFITRHWLRTDWWMASTDALRYGFVDEVR